jgi:hypothetical protein
LVYYCLAIYSGFVYFQRLAQAASAGPLVWSTGKYPKAGSRNIQVFSQFDARLRRQSA